ncbi:hypothetical protein BH23CHL5_BH23CHL5_24360 [soil metagenome]
MTSGIEVEPAEIDPSANIEITGYELFILTLSLYSIFNLFLLLLPFSAEQKRIVVVMEIAVGMLFLFDFLRRLVLATHRRHYFVHQFGWLDLIAGIPIPGFRLAKIAGIRRAGIHVRDYGFRLFKSEVNNGRAANALLIAVLATLLVLQFGSMLVVEREIDASDSNIRSAGDAIWWSYVTITTVGYGDKYPVTIQGRLVGILMLSLGVALFAVITGYLSNAFINPRAAREEEARQRVANQQEMAELRRSVEALRSDIDSLSKQLRNE